MPRVVVGNRPLRHTCWHNSLTLFSSTCALDRRLNGGGCDPARLRRIKTVSAVGGTRIPGRPGRILIVSEANGQSVSLTVASEITGNYRVQRNGGSRRFRLLARPLLPLANVYLSSTEIIVTA